MKKSDDLRVSTYLSLGIQESEHFLGSEKIRQCALENPDLPIEFLKELLIAKQQDRSLAEPFNFE